ncbi:TetR family transcriptional regulator [Georgenia deserti]|uniref:TetR family transcriptional regulator n=1 Tax=Georgenia deserti TaxID=2093781 RepID=A0ABW4KY09_9MICO
MPITSDAVAADGEAPTVDGRTARWAGHRATRRAELVRAARRAVHDLGPDVSMDDIAGHMGTSKPILYRYFTDKTGLQVAVGQAVLGRMRAAIEDAAAAARGPRARIAAMVRVYLEMVDASPHVYAFVTRPEATAREVRGFAGDVADLVVDALLPALTGDLDDGAAPARAEVDPDTLIAARLWAAGVVGLVRGAVDVWLGDRVDTADPAAPATDLDREALADHLTNWLWDGAVGVLRRARNATTGA